MIEYIRGIVDEVTPTQAVIEASGVGYALSISLNTYTAIQNKKEARLFVYEVIREDAYLLFDLLLASSVTYLHYYSAYRALVDKPHA